MTVQNIYLSPHIKWVEKQNHHHHHHHHSAVEQATTNFLQVNQSDQNKIPILDAGGKPCARWSGAWEKSTGTSMDSQSQDSFVAFGAKRGNYWYHRLKKETSAKPCRLQAVVNSKCQRCKVSFKSWSSL